MFSSSSLCSALAAHQLQEGRHDYLAALAVRAAGRDSQHLAEEKLRFWAMPRLSCSKIFSVDLDLS